MYSSALRLRKSARLLALLAVSTALTGCILTQRSNRHQATSVAQFLYPGENQPFVEPTIPTLRLPLRVGVAFAPSTESSHPHAPKNATLSEMEKAELLRKISAQFKILPFVYSIEIVPTTYLRPGGGFSNLDQLRTLMGIDVIALVAYDQSQNSSETAWSLAYWTLVGAYIVPAQKNDTHTLMEAVVYDIPSRNLLFRAPGVSATTGHSTIIRTDAELAADSARGMTEAAADLTVNLQAELDRFKVRAREEPSTIHLEPKPGFSGAGDAGRWFGLTVLLFLCGRGAATACILLSRRTHRCFPLSGTN